MNDQRNIYAGHSFARSGGRRKCRLSFSARTAKLSPKIWHQRVKISVKFLHQVEFEVRVTPTNKMAQSSTGTTRFSMM